VDVWDPAQYLKFADHRLRPALDLLARVAVAAPATVYDLGCGPGNVTAFLAERWPGARVVGVDGSAAMLAKARAERPALAWQEADIATWRPQAPADVIYSNATLHWLDDHERLFPRLISSVSPGGALAVQMPRNFQEPSHTAMAESAAAGPWRAKAEKALRAFPMPEVGRYHDWLAPLARALDIWETVYIQALEGDDPVAEWTKGTSLKPVLDALDGAERQAFFADYAARCRRAYPKRADGKTLFPFRRLFIVATK
jgi:trans-aconitate 2-methyltransferase